jgi:hypothetical protein
MSINAILPPLVRRLVYGPCQAWIIGSAAQSDAVLDRVRDFDVLVPYAKWPEASLLIPAEAKPNTFGGWKCESEGRVVDVWPDDIGRLLINNLTKAVWHPHSNQRWIIAR